MDGYDSKPSKGQFSKSEGENRVVYDNNEVLDFCDSTKGKFSQVPPYRGSYGGPTMSGYDGNLHSHGAYSGPRYESSAMGHYSGASSSGSDRTYMMGYTTERKSPQSYEQEPGLQTSNVHEDHQHRGEGGLSGMTGFDYYSADAMLGKKDFFASEGLMLLATSKPDTGPSNSRTAPSGRVRAIMSGSTLLYLRA